MFGLTPAETSFVTHYESQPLSTSGHPPLGTGSTDEGSTALFQPRACMRVIMPSNRAHLVSVQASSQHSAASPPITPASSSSSNLVIWVGGGGVGGSGGSRPKNVAAAPWLLGGTGPLLNSCRLMRGPIYDAHKVGHYIKDRSDHLKAGYTSKSEAERAVASQVGHRTSATQYGNARPSAGLGW